METKSIYESPETEIVSLKVFMSILGDDPYLPQVSDNQLDAKSAGDVIEDEDPELAAPIKDKWEDLNEKKNGK